ncbi:MAG: AAA family ATPase [Ilumatobacteraceae bacterium]
MRFDHLSRLAKAWLSADEPPRWQALPGSAVLADLSGFTRLTETLSARGAEGTEVLHRALTLCFSSMLGPALVAGGDVIGFAGDAALVWFDGDGHERRAAQAAIAMPENLARLPAAVTGGRRLRASVGVHAGTFTAMLVGSQQRSIVWCGPEMSTLVRLEAAASHGQVLASPTIAARLDGDGVGPPAGPGVELRRRGRRGAAELAERSISDDRASTGDGAVDRGVLERWMTLLSPAVHTLVTADVPVADHRSASIGFIALDGLGDRLRREGPDAVHDALGEMVNAVVAVADELSVAWLDTDVGPDGIKLLLAAGAPHAVEDDEGRMLFALRRMLDECSVPLRAGAQRGQVFACALGVPGRRTFTLLGDPVNVAARALGVAGARELVVGDGLGVAERTFVTASSLGPMQLKNRTAPMEMWRVDRVGAPSPVQLGQFGRVNRGRRGRTSDADRVASAWKRAVAGRGAALSVVGEAGMGSSALLQDVAELAGGAATLVAGDPFRSLVPYSTVASIVVALAAAAGHGEDDRAASGEGSSTEIAWRWLAPFAPMLPETERDWLDDAAAAIQRRPVGPGADPVATARRARGALVALIAAAAPSPWLLAVDRFDDVDDASRLTIHDLRELADERPWFVVTASRPSETSDHSGRADTLALAPLDPDEAAQLVLEVEPLLRDDQVNRIVAAANGNPFVLTELVQHPDRSELPDSLERLATARIDALHPRLRVLVRDASAFGRSVPLDLIGEVLGRPELADPEAWSGTQAVLRPVGPRSLVFRHDAYRLAAYASLTFQRRRQLHGAIADRLVESGGVSDAELSLHFEEAGRTREAFPLAVAAGRSAAASGALVEAGELLGRAARMARIVDRSARGMLLLEQGDALMQLGDLAGAGKAFRSAGRELGDPLDFADLCSHRADLAIRRARYAEARAAARRGLLLTAPFPEAAELRGTLLLDDAAALHFMGRHGDSRELATDALAAAVAVSSPMLEARAHLHLEMVLSNELDPRAVEHGARAVEIFESIGHHRHLAEALSNCGLTAMGAGRWNEAIDLYGRAAAAAARTGDTRTVAIVELNTAFLVLRQGRPELADAFGARASRVFEAAGLELLGAYAWLLRSQVAAAESRYADADRLLAAARDRFEGLHDRAMLADCDVVAMDRLLRQDRHHDALALVPRVERNLPLADETVHVTFGLCRGLAEVGSGHVETGVALIDDALDRARRTERTYEEYLCLGALVDLEQTHGRRAPIGARADRDGIASRLGIHRPIG